MASFALTFVTPLLLALAAGYVAWREAPKPVALALGTLSLAFPAYAVVVGGDWMAMGRFLIPGFAFGALLMGWLMTRLWEHLSSMVETATVARLVKHLVFVVLVGSTIAVGLLPAWNVHLVPDSVGHAFHFRYDWEYKATEFELWREVSFSIGEPSGQRSSSSTQDASRTGRQHRCGRYRETRLLLRFGNL